MLIKNPTTPLFDIEKQIVEAMQSNGVTPPLHIIIDGTVHHTDDHGVQDEANGNVWYIAFPNTGIAQFGDYRTQGTEGIKFIPTEAAREREKSAEERQKEDEDFKKLQEELKAKAQQRALQFEIKAQDCYKLWASLPNATDDFPYLVKKGVKAEVGKVKYLQQGFFKNPSTPVIVLPVMDKNGRVRSLEYIDADGNKTFEKGAEKGGNFLKIGPNAYPVYMAEGYATCKSIQEATGKAVICCFDAYNMVEVASLFPFTKVVADNDAKKQNTGLKKALEIKERYGNDYILIPDDGLDANDYAQKYGLTALKHLLGSKDLTGFKTMKEIEEMPYQDEEFLIYNRVSKGSNVEYLGAQYGVGKTFLGLSWALSIAYGLPDWFGYKVAQGRVAYFAGESCRSLRKRLDAFTQKNNLPSYTDNFIAFYGSGVKFGEGNTFEYVQTELAGYKFKPDLIVIDHQQAYTTGNDNDQEVAKKNVEAFKQLAEYYDCCVLVVHHYGKDAEKGLRGAQTYGDFAGFIHGLTKANDGSIVLEQSKAKEEAKADTLKCHLEVETLGYKEDGTARTSCVFVSDGKITPQEATDDTKDTKTRRQDQDVLEGFLKAGGMYKDDDGLHFTRHKLVDYLVNECEWTDKKAKDNTNPNSTNSVMIRRLIAGGNVGEPKPLKAEDYKDFEFTVINTLALVLNFQYDVKVKEEREKEQGQPLIE